MSRTTVAWRALRRDGVFIAHCGAEGSGPSTRTPRNPQSPQVVIPARFRFPSLLSCLAIACLLPAGCRQQAPAPVEPPPKTVVASGSEDAGAVSSDAKPAVPTQAEVLKGTDWPALRLVSGDAWID